MTAADSQVSEQTRQYFLQEATDLLRLIDDELQDLRANFSLLKVHSLMRAAHTLKGASASAGLETVTKLAHSLEDIFKALCYEDTVVSLEMERLIFEGYECLQLLMSAQLEGANVDEADILDRMAGVVTLLQKMLGDRFGQSGHLPTSSELGFDLTRSIFEVGVAQRIEALSEALENPQPAELLDLLLAQMEVFVGLAESLALPGFEAIAQTTLTALQQQPENVLTIAPIVLENLKAAHAAVLAGDRQQGGSPSLALQQLGGSALSFDVDSDKQLTKRDEQISTQGAIASKPSWLKRRWQALTNKGDRAAEELSPVDPFASEEKQASEGEELAALIPVELDDLTLELPELLALDSPEENLPEARLEGLSENLQNSSTIRMSVEHLNQLSQTMGELLSEQNRQTLYNEQLTALVKKLLGRISQQQQQLNRHKEQSIPYRDFLADSRQPSVIQPRPHSISSSHPGYASFDALELDRYSDSQLLVQACLEETVQQSESAEAIELFVRRSQQALEKQKRLLANSRETLLTARMVPLEKVFKRLLPTLERLQVQYHKQVEVLLKGNDVLVDKVIVDKLYEPLLHLVRNAFDHGIEPPEERLAQDKLAASTITIEGIQRGQHLLIHVIDNGRGLDLEAIRRQAVEDQRVTTAQAAALTFEQTVDLLFEVGFSTARELDELSGRGIGLDAVRSQAQSLKGDVSVSHELGAGTCFTLQIPSTITIAKLLLCQAEGRTYALIADAVEHILMPSAEQVRAWEGGKMLTWQAGETEYLIPVLALCDVLHYASPVSNHLPLAFRQGIEGDRIKGNLRKKAKTSHPVILLRHQDTLVGLEVDQLSGEQELVISPLGKTIVPPAYLYGSSILPDGQLTLVLDGMVLAKVVSEQRSRSPLDEKAMPSNPTLSPPAKDKPIFLKKLVLTVDDSITVRNALSEALQRANYQVIQARDGAEALEQLQRYPDVQAILCDIEMPGMNGFEFLKARQANAAIAHIPTIMLTSRAGSKHRQLTEELGATTYITKPYLTPLLLKALAEAIENQAHPQPSISITITGER
ncbi:MAG: response regulator [Phormidesmis sp.]